MVSSKLTSLIPVSESILYGEKEEKERRCYFIMNVPQVKDMLFVEAREEALIENKVVSPKTVQMNTTMIESSRNERVRAEGEADEVIFVKEVHKVDMRDNQSCQVVSSKTAIITSVRPVSSATMVDPFFDHSSPSSKSIEFTDKTEERTLERVECSFASSESGQFSSPLWTGSEMFQREGSVGSLRPISPILTKDGQVIEGNFVDAQTLENLIASPVPPPNPLRPLRFSDSQRLVIPSPPPSLSPRFETQNDSGDVFTTYNDDCSTLGLNSKTHYADLIRSTALIPDAIGGKGIEGQKKKGITEVEEQSDSDGDIQVLPGSSKPRWLKRRRGNRMSTGGRPPKKKHVQGGWGGMIRTRE